MKTNVKFDTKVQFVPTCTHWGNFLVEIADNQITAIHNYDEELEPTAIGQSLLNVMDPDCRVSGPMIREGYLKKGLKSDRTMRGKEPFVAVSWDDAIEIAANELSRIKKEYGNQAIYGGSYGWASAGRFHHALSQIHRFLKMFGGYTESVDTYSCAAAEVIIPHVLGVGYYDMCFQTPPWEEVLKNSELVVAFGGISMKNTQVNEGGIGIHNAQAQMKRSKEYGLKIINISPLKEDMPSFVNAEWIAPRPNTDTAIILGIAHTLIQLDLYDKSFIQNYCSGFDTFKSYLLGNIDGQLKNADWASKISSISKDTIISLATQMATKRTLIALSWSVQRCKNGEQTYWSATALAAMLGHIGKPGLGIGYGYGAEHCIGFMGRKKIPFKWGCFEQGTNPINSFIPVARISDMLLNPNTMYDYNGSKLTYPDIKLIYWAGGNPFHHQQDLNRLRRAWTHPETIIINESVWNATARHADIIFPATSSLERNDIGCCSYDYFLTPMRQALAPFESSKSDFEIFSELARKLGFADQFTENRNEMEWIKHIYDQSRNSAETVNIKLPEFEEFWNGSQFSIEDQLDEIEFDMEKFRRDPNKFPLGTPSGRIELFSKTIADFNYPDCPGYPAWIDNNDEWLGSKRATKYPLHLISNQPKTRLHSQLDHGVTSRESKIHGREVMTIHPLDARKRQIKDGGLAKIYNDRGACIAAVRFSEELARNIVVLPTGAWFDPDDDNDSTLELHGNPNVLTKDIGTSSLAQGPSAHSCLVEVEAYKGDLPDVTVFKLPVIK